MVIVGIDEVGRGCLAGPLVAAAVVLERRINGLKDSKLLSREQREKVAVRIRLKAAAIGLGWVEPQLVDSLGLTAASRLAMQQALNQISVAYDQVIIDGSYNYLVGNDKVSTIIKADQTVKAVSAASIIAKVARDNYMRRICIRYPQYGFDSHVGYGTPQHLLMLKQHGVSELHRRSYAPVAALLQLAA